MQTWVDHRIAALEKAGDYEGAIRLARMYRMAKETVRLQAAQALRDPRAPLALRISSAARLGWGVKLKGDEEKPRQVVFFHPPTGKPAERIQFNPT